MSERVVRVAGLSFTLGRYSSLVPPLTGEEFTSLAADIYKRGVVVPVLVDESGVVIDGENRVEIAAAQEQDRVPVEVVKGLSEEAKAELAVAVNTTRRQIGPEKRAEITKRLVKAGLSKRAVAKQLGVDDKTIAADLQRSTAECSAVEHADRKRPRDPQCLPEQPKKSKGLDGKQRPATKPDPAEIAARAERVKEKSKAGKSVREIAKEEGVSTGTVARDLAPPPPEPGPEDEPAAPVRTEFVPKVRDLQPKLVKQWEALAALHDETRGVVDGLHKAAGAAMGLALGEGPKESRALLNWLDLADKDVSSINAAVGIARQSLERAQQIATGLLSAAQRAGVA